MAPAASSWRELSYRGALGSVVIRLPAPVNPDAKLTDAACGLPGYEG